MLTEEELKAWHVTHGVRNKIPERALTVLSVISAAATILSYGTFDPVITVGLALCTLVQIILSFHVRNLRIQLQEAIARQTKINNSPFGVIGFIAGVEDSDEPFFQDSGKVTTSYEPPPRFDSDPRR
jgi:CHASE2 domain-containing sensor protein